jgi:hypothetical protein
VNGFLRWLADLFERFVIMIGWLAALLGLFLGIVGLAVDWAAIVPLMEASETNPVARSFPDLFVYYWSYFTHLTNLGLVLVYAASLTSWRWLGWFRAPISRAVMAAYIALVMAFFHFMLAPLYDFSGLLAIGNVLLHYVCPILYLGWWLAFAPHGSLSYRHIPLMLIPGLVYVVWVLVRGLWAHEYPYTILDPTQGGYGAVALGVLMIAVAIAAFSAILVWLDMRLIARQRASRA